MVNEAGRITQCTRPGSRCSLRLVTAAFGEQAPACHESAQAPALTRKSSARTPLGR
jgi:hypothetical protein